MTYAAALAGYGYAVHELATIDHARDALMRGTFPHILVIDVARTKDMANFVRFVREELAMPTSILVIGANAREAETAFHSGASEFLARPAELAELLHTVQACLAI